MLNSIEQLFHLPKKELKDSFLIKDDITYQNFINIYLQLDTIEDKINSLKSIINIFSQEKSLLNICYFCSKNIKQQENEFVLDESLDKSNFSCFLPQENFQQWLIEEFFKETNENLKIYLKELFAIIISVYGIDKYYLNLIYEELTKKYFYQKEEEKNELNIEEFLLNLKFFGIGYGLDAIENNNNLIKKYIYNTKPYNFYFFKGKESIKIIPTISSNEKSKINDGITLFICFKCLLNPVFNNTENNNNLHSNLIFSNIFNILFNNGNKLLLKIDAEMNLILILSDNKKNNSIILTKIDENKWYNISINLNTNKNKKKFQLNIIINNTPLNNIKEIESENAKISEINNISLCENFTGFITNFILFNKLLEKDSINFYQNKFRYGLYKYSHVNKFIEKLNQNIIKNLIVVLIPTNVYGTNELQNLANNYGNSNKLTNNFDIKYISGYSDKLNIVNVIINNRFDKKINLLGGIENIFPFVEILMKISKNDIGDKINIFQNCLFIIISIINTILIDKKNNLESISKLNLFEIMNIFFQNLNVISNNNIQKEIFNSNIADEIINLSQYLFNNSEKFGKICVKSFLNNFLFNIKIINKFSLQNQNLIFTYISNNITKINSEDILNLNVDNLLFILQYYNENYKNYFCCEYHKNFYSESNKKLIDVQSLFNSVTQIIGKVSNYNQDIYLKILQFLLIKSKPCLIKFIIKNIFKANLMKNNNKSKKEENKSEKNKFIKYLVKSNLLNTLLFLLSTYVYPDIVNEIINLFSLISTEIKLLDNNNINNFFNKDKNINYISDSILPIYIRIKPRNQSKENAKEKNKKLIMSEIVFPKDKNEINNLDDKNSDNSNDDDNYDGLGKKDNNFIKFMSSGKSRAKHRKKSGDNFFVPKKFNLEKILTMDLGDMQLNTNRVNKRLNFEENSKFNATNEKINIIRPQKKLKSVVESVVNFARFDNNKIQKMFQKQDIESIYENSLKEYRKLDPILLGLGDKKINSYKKIILEALLDWLKIDFSHYVIKIISNFLNNYKIEYVHICEFIDVLSAIINEQIYTKKFNITLNTFNLEFYFWFIDCMFQFYLVNSDKKDLIFSNNIIIFPENKDEKMKEIIPITIKKGLKILISIIINIKLEKNDIIKLFDILLLCGTRIKKYYSLNQNTIIFLNNFYSEFFTEILKEYNKYYSSANSEQLLPIINICYEYMLFFNNENKSEEINNFMANDNQFFNGIILSGINTNKIENKNITNLQLSKFWTDYELFKTIMKVLKQIINIDNCDYKDDKYLEENITSHKKSDTFLDQICFLCNCKLGNNNNNVNNTSNNNIDKPSINKEEIKNGELPLIYIISNLYVITINLASKKEEKEEIINEYKMYIIFLILSSSNLSSNTPNLNTIQTRVELILNYFIGFIIERYNNNLDRDLLIPCLVDVFILMIKILKRTYDQRSKRKGSQLFSKIISITTTQKKIDFSKCAVFKIFSRENMANVFNKDFVTNLKKNNFKFFNDKSYLINLLISCVDLKSIQKEIKHIFFANKYLEKGQERILKINKMKNEDMNMDNTAKKNWDYQYDIQYFKMRKKIEDIMQNNLSALEEEIKLFKEKKFLEKEKAKLSYKKIKKKIFSFTGLWSYKDIFYKKDLELSDYNDDEIVEKNLSSENSLDEMINSEKNKYQNKHILKYKLINHYGKIPLRPVLAPIYDINAYLPNFSKFKKDNLFIENEQGKDITSIMNLNMNEIFNEKENETDMNLYENANEEECDIITLNIFKNIFSNIYNEFNNKIYPNLSTYKLKSAPLSGYILNSHKCCYIIQMSHIKGFLYLDNNFCHFIQNIYDENAINENNKKKKEKDEDLDEEKKMCYGSYLKLNKSKYVYFKINYTSIQFIFLRTYYYKESAIEIYTSKNKVYYLNFPDSFKRQNFLNLLLGKFPSKKEIKIFKTKLIGYNLSPIDNTYIDFIINNNNSDFISNILENWNDWNISTMELLLWLNILSNRSFNDISQYPVFPWILTQYQDIFPTPIKENNSLSKSYLPEINSKTNDPFTQSNSGDIKTKTRLSGFLKIGKKKSVDDPKPKNMDNTNQEIKEKNSNYDQFIVEDKKSQLILDKAIRDFSLPMGMMTLNEAGQKRKNNYLEKYTLTKKEFSELNQKENNFTSKLYIYGSHYSNPLYVCHYLTRVFPYSNISIELQGDKFDDPNRMLLSVSKSFEGSTSHEGDLRELCPEFYYLPELFKNKNNLDLKIKTKNNKNKSNDVTLPIWANNNNYIFITKLKTYLESEEVNKTIHKWFDLIFGFKQKGKEAENANNLFIPSSYDNFDINKESPEQKLYYLRLTEFGLTPHQIINKKINKRKPKDNKKKSISENWREKEPIKKRIDNNKNDNGKMAFKLIKLQFIDNEKFMGILNNYQYIKNDIINFQNEIDNIRFDSNMKFYIKKEKIEKLNFLRVKKNEIMEKSYPIIIYSKGTFIAEGGYNEGRIIVSQLNLKAKSKNTNNSESSIIQTFDIFNKSDTSPVIVLLITKDEKYIFSGSMYGNIVVYKNLTNTWKKKYQINDHLNIPITSIYHNDILNIWGSAGYDGYVNIYTFPSNKKISSIKVEKSACSADYIFISSSPLACFIIYSGHNFTFYTYSLIGNLICKVSEVDNFIYSPKILKESNFGEVLIYGNDKGQINMRFLPSLDLFLKRGIDENEGYNYISLDLVDVSKKGWYLITWNNENGILYAIYDHTHISENEELMIIYLANGLDE